MNSSSTIRAPTVGSRRSGRKQGALVVRRCCGRRCHRRTSRRWWRESSIVRCCRSQRRSRETYTSGERVREWESERVREWESERVRVREWESERVREWESESERVREWEWESERERGLECMSPDKDRINTGLCLALSFRYVGMRRTGASVLSDSPDRWCHVFGVCFQCEKKHQHLGAGLAISCGVTVMSFPRVASFAIIK